MIYNLSNKGNLKLVDDACSRMLEYTQNSQDCTEAGGVLLGRFIKGSKSIVVDRVTVPMIGDKRSRYTFHRGEKMHQRVITSAWNKSNGTCHYLGEWHTHPENYPTPSSVDLNNWKRILLEGVFSSLYLYFVIVGIKEVRVWEGNRKTLQIKRLK